jgi:hypothetical protein
LINTLPTPTSIFLKQYSESVVASVADDVHDIDMIENCRKM